MKANTIIVSDWHLGLSVVQTKKIKSFLDQIINGQIQTNTLILNGDIFDLNWEKLNTVLKDYHDILTKIVKINQLGVKIIYILGNHDPLTNKQKNTFFNTLNEIGLNNIQITRAYQIRINGFIYLVVHGHEFDLFIVKHPFISNMSDLGYRSLIYIDNLLGIGLTEMIANFVRKFFDYPKTLEMRCRWFLKKRFFNGIIVGHTHAPQISTWKIKTGNKIKLTNQIKDYLKKYKSQKNTETKFFGNSGDWVESRHCTYLSINKNGKVELNYFK